MSDQALREVDTFSYKGITKEIAISERESALESVLVVFDGFWLEHSRNIVTRQPANCLKSSENVLKSLLNSGNGSVSVVAEIFVITMISFVFQ